MEGVKEQLLREVKVGDLVRLVVDGKFFQRRNGQDEKYAGYVASISGEDIALSPTHHDNIKHGYTRRNTKSPERVKTEIKVSLVNSYEVLK